MIHFFKCVFRVTQGTATTTKSVGLPNHAAVIADVLPGGKFAVVEQNVAGDKRVRTGSLLSM